MDPFETNIIEKACLLFRFTGSLTPLEKEQAPKAKRKPASKKNKAAGASRCFAKP